MRSDRPAVRLSAIAFATAVLVCGPAAGQDRPATRPAASAPAIDDILHHAGWRDGTFGPTGRRLFTERLDHGLGLRGQFSYIHYADIRDPIRLAILHDGREIDLTEQSIDWYPSHLVAHYATVGLEIAEHKFITDDDVLVDLLAIANRSAEPFDAQIVYTSGIATRRGDSSAPAGTLIGSGVFAGVQVSAVAWAPEFEPAGQDRLVRPLRIEPGRSIDLRVALGMAEDVQIARQQAMAWLHRPDPLADHRRAYQKWFDDNCPDFDCDDPYMTKAWWYRMFVMRHCLSRAGAGNLPYPYFFEGTHEKHFPRLIAFSSPHIIAEARWLRDGDYAWGQVLDHARNPDDQHHFFISARADKKGGDYNNWITAAAWDLYQVHPERTRLQQVIDAMAADVRGTLSLYDPDGDLLPTPRSHWTTGMEFQPAFFYFNDYDDTKPDARLERPDFAAYLYANARAVAAACRELGRPDEARSFDELADRIRRAGLDKMWDQPDRFFYAVRESDDAKARVREVVGFYPFAFGLVPDEMDYAKALRYLVDPAEFWTPFPPATVSKTCPAYTPIPEHWPAAGGRTHGCMWNGPAWPHATSVTLDAVAAAIRRYRQDQLKPKHFWHMLDRYTHLHFSADDLTRPLLREYNHGETGQATGCPDYFHSTFCDLIVRHVAGLQPRGDDRLVVRPIPGPLRRFTLRGLGYRNHSIDIVYNFDRPWESPVRADLPVPRCDLMLIIDGRRTIFGDLAAGIEVDLNAEEHP